MEEKKITNDIKNIFTFVKEGTKDSIITELKKYYLYFREEDKYDYSDIILNKLQFYINNDDKVNNDHIYYIDFFNSSEILDYCNIGMIQHLLEDFYYHSKPNLYIYLIKYCGSNKKYNSLLEDHIISFYTHPKQSSVWKFSKISNLLTIEIIKKCLQQTISRKCTSITYFIIYHFDKKITKLNISEYQNYIDNIVKYLDKTTMCKDEYTIVLDYIFG